MTKNSKKERDGEGKFLSGHTAIQGDQSSEVSKIPFSKKVWERLNDLRFDPVTKLVDLAKNARSQQVQLEATCKLLDKVAPSLKSVEIDGNTNDHGYQLNIFYSKNASEILKDPTNVFLGTMAKCHQNSKDL